MIGAVILNYNSYNDTIQLVSELQKQTYNKDILIVIVDNASPNDSYSHLKQLEKKYTNAVVLQTGANLGYAKGNNFGLRYLDEKIHPDYVAILNNDIQLPYDCFEKLTKKYTLLENPAIIAPKQLDTSHKEVLPSRMNSFLDDCLSMFLIFRIFYKSMSSKYQDNTAQHAMKVDMIPGSFMFASFERFKAMGFFYPNTFLFVEERFIAVKAKQMGWYNYILLDQTYIHAHSKTINSALKELEKYRFLYKGWFEFTLKHRNQGKLKCRILKILATYSLFELRILIQLKSILNFIANKMK